MPLTICFVLTNMRYTITVQPLMFVFVALTVAAAVKLDGLDGPVDSPRRASARTYAQGGNRRLIRREATMTPAVTIGAWSSTTFHEMAA